MELRKTFIAPLVVALVGAAIVTSVSPWLSAAVGIGLLLVLLALERKGWGLRALAHASPIVVVWRGPPGRRRGEAEPAGGVPNLPREAPAMALYVPTDAVGRYADAATGGNCLYAHMEVSADSAEALRGCHVRLVRVMRTVDGKWQRDERFAAPIRLCWAYAGGGPETEYRAIHPGETAQVDVAFTLERAPGRAYIPSASALPDGLPRDLVPGFYILTVRVLAEGHDPVDCDVMLGVLDNWLGLTISQSTIPPDQIG